MTSTDAQSPDFEDRSDAREDEGSGLLGPFPSDPDVETDVLVLEQEELEMVLPVWEPTGDPEVDAALDDLSALDELPSCDHAGVFDSVHRKLHGRLSGLAAGA